MYGNAGRSFGEIMAAATLNQIRMALWSGKGKKPELIDLDPPQVKQSRKDGRTEHYGVAITTEELIRLMGDHIPRA